MSRYLIKLSGTTVLAGTVLSIMAPAWAQDAGQEAKEGERRIDEIIVQGIRAANRGQIEAKNDINAVSDSISADDIGSLPDFNLAEALQRIPGISTDQDNGEDRFVVVRGLSSEYNFSTIDGLILPSTDSASRAVLYDIVPSTAAQRVDVYKSFSADMDGQAIGGRIDMVTRSAFNLRNNYFTTKGAYGHMDYTDLGPEEVDPSSRISSTYATKFGESEQFGVVLSGSYFKRDTYAVSPTTSGTAPYYFYDSEGNRLADLETVDDVKQAAYVVPENANLYLYRSDRERYGAIAKGEFAAPNESFYGYLQAFHFERIDRERRDQSRYRNRNGNITPEDITPSSGRVVGASEPANDLVVQKFEDRTQGLHTGLNWKLNDVSRLEFKTGYSTAELDNPESNALFYRPSRADAGFSYTIDPDDGFLILTPTDPSASDPDQLGLYRIAFEDERNEEDVWESRLDYSWNLEDKAEGLGFKTGAKYRSFSREKDTERTEYRPASGNTVSLGDWILDETWNDAPNYTVPIRFINSAVFGGLDLGDETIFSVHSSSESASKNSDYQIDEDVLALYFMGVYNTPNWKLNVGVRYEQTDINASAFQLYDGEFVPYATESSYNNVLPRADFAYDFSERWRLRLAYSRSLGRPDYSDIAPYRSVSIDGGANVVYISGGNPEVKPRVADNYDISLERYFDGFNGLFAVGVFHKDIKDEIFPLRNIEFGVDFDGLTDVDVVTTKPSNAESAALTGLEIGLIINRFDFLPNGFWQDFGIAANYTYIDSNATFAFVGDVAGEQVNLSRDVPLFFQPEKMANASLFYKGLDFEARLSYNYKDKHLKAINDADVPWSDRYYDSRSRVDAQFQYYLNDHLRLSLEGKNLTDTYPHEIYAAGYHHTVRQTGREFWLGFSYQF